MSGYYNEKNDQTFQTYNITKETNRVMYAYTSTDNDTNMVNSISNNKDEIKQQK